MSMTATTLIAHVRVEIGEATASFWTDAQLIEYVSRAAQDFSVDTGILVAPPVQASSVANSGLYSYPTSCPGPHSIIRVFYDGKELQPTTQDALIGNGNKPHSDSGTPTHYYTAIYAGVKYLGLCPIPGSAVTNGIVIYFWKIADIMDAGADVCEIPDEYYRALVYRASMFAFGPEGEKSKQAYYNDLYTQEVIRAQDYINAQIVASLKDKDSRNTSSRTYF